MSYEKWYGSVLLLNNHDNFWKFWWKKNSIFWFKFHLSSGEKKKLNIVRFLHQVPSGLNYTETKPEISLPDFLENELKTHFPELPLFLLSHGFYKAAQVTIVFWNFIIMECKL